MKYKIVKIKNLKEEYKKLGLNVDSLGLMLNGKDGKALTMFFNGDNLGDYLVLVADKTDLRNTDMILPDELCAELEAYIQNNFDKIANKTDFREIPFNECDEVELISQKEKYSIYGLNKGDRGIVATNNATKDKILIDFGNAKGDFDGFVSANLEDIKKV